MSDNDMRIVPERDEIRSRSKPVTKSASKSSAGARAPKTSSAKPSSGSGSSVMSLVFGVLIVALAGTCAYLYMQAQNLQVEKEALSARVADIESKLSYTDESLSESGAAIQAVLKDQGEALELHMSEIRKLWAVAYDRNRVAIEKLQGDQQNTSTRMDSLSSSVANFDPIAKGYEGVQSRMDTIASQLLVQSVTLDDLSETSRKLSDAQASETNKNTELSKLIQEHQEAINAIDQYRIQINQRLLRLEQNLAPANAAGS